MIRLERALAGLGGLLLAWIVVVSARSVLYQHRAAAVIEQELIAYGVEAPPDPFALPLPAVGDPIGRLEIPRLELAVVVAEGDDNGTLDVAVGHLPDTPLPWAVGNSSFAAHRDTLFRPLRNIRMHDEVRMVTARGTFNYRVSKLSIVKPTDLSVLAPTHQFSLTLITCYPFNYIGHAPQRFVVQATRFDNPAEF